MSGGRSWYHVHYPNGTRLVSAYDADDAQAVAMERWGTIPTLIEEVEL